MLRTLRRALRVLAAVPRQLLSVELLTGVNRLGDGGQVIVEPSIGDHFEQRALVVGPALGSLAAAGALSRRPRMIARPPD